MRRMLWGGMLALGALFVQAEGTPAKKEAVSPATVSDEVMRFLSVKLTRRVTDMEPSLALEWQLKVENIPLVIEATGKANATRVSFELVDATLAETLRTISSNTGVHYRIVGKTIFLAMPEEWKEIDAGKKRFEDLVERENKKETNR